ncbi:hypothetical protein LY90DRAFT_501066 [Neocallimastix californiae]|uniref:Uncharacterized protein n=1 Tax=Neocallimastix californiae TaxID=1754190 RepID=A0A1Y2F333_9FUNG|nr:hypothetical protein LY90DRAFT_501066 [Neocallimastix californiae]|eukprot:ORY78300.1 hypothetical protein LY90DRAFT_501066 [Neocallimastix californiae]
MSTSYPVGVYPPFNNPLTRNNTTRGECGNSSNSQDLNNMINNSSSSLNEIINGLKYKYVELQEKNKNDLKKLEEEIEKEKKEFPKKDTEIEKLNMDIDMLKNEVTLLKGDY